MQGGTHILRHMGKCCSNGSLFHKKALNMGPIFYRNIPKYGSVYLKFPKFFGCLAEKWANILRKIPKNKKVLFFFFQKLPLEKGMGFKPGVAHPRSNQI